MKAQAFILVGGVLGGLGLGWLTSPEPEVDARGDPQTPIVSHAGVEAAEVRERLSRLELAPPIEVALAPPAPDIAVLFRRDLTAIENRGGRKVVWIVDYTQAHQRRALRVGDVYQDGWRVFRIGTQSVVLRRRRETRTVDAFALPVLEP